MSVLALLLTIAVLLLLVPVVVLTLQVVFALLPGRGAPVPAGPRPRVAVLVPAHDEEDGIAATVSSIRSQLRSGDRLVVVADNCSDHTAIHAREAGAEAIVRRNPALRGKGYALDFGVRYLGAAPPEVVVIVDADCELGEGALDRLAHVCAASRCPVQALYLTRAQPGAGLKARIGEFAWAVKNYLRPLGYLRVGLPCHLMGSGMAFPWAVLRDAELASGHIVEDLKLGLDLARAGKPPLFCPEALVTSVFPLSEDGRRSQSTRWEHGHLGVIAGDAPRLLMSALARFDLRLLALVLDLCVPPLALLTLLAFLAFAASAAALAAGGASIPFALAVVVLLLLSVTVLIAWASCGRGIISLGDLARAPFYALSKIPLYLGFLLQRQVDWVRSRRDAS